MLNYYRSIRELPDYAKFIWTSEELKSTSKVVNKPGTSCRGDDKVVRARGDKAPKCHI